jgi:hypothetical protein
MPQRYGYYKSVWERHKKWSECGVWKKVMEALVSNGYASGKAKMDSVSIDSSTIPAKKGES